jgi:hypothetical protein
MKCMTRPPLGGRMTCESCPSVDVRQWQRKGRLYPGQQFSWSWTRGAEPAGSIAVRVESDAVVLNYRAESSGSGEWKSVQQRVPIRLTACHLGDRATILREAEVSMVDIIERRGKEAFLDSLFVMEEGMRHYFSKAMQAKTPRIARRSSARLRCRWLTSSNGAARRRFSIACS